MMSNYLTHIQMGVEFHAYSVGRGLYVMIKGAIRVVVMLK
jgi:hypothetical protein